MKLLTKIIFIVFFIHNSTLLFAYDIKKTGEADLNGDNKLEKILLSVNTYSGEFVLKINNTSTNGVLIIEESDDLDKEIGYKIVDIDKRDKYKEIEIYYDGGRYDLVEIHIYSFDGNSIQMMMDPLIMDPSYSGYGIVLTYQWESFWTRREKYVLNQKTRKLDLVPQELYYMGVTVEVKEMFPIYRTRVSFEIVANLRPASTCLILVCDFNGWYLIKSATGLVGWTKDLSKLILPVAG